MLDANDQYLFWVFLFTPKTEVGSIKQETHNILIGGCAVNRVRAFAA